MPQDKNSPERESRQARQLIVDQHVGHRIRARRNQLKRSQQHLADHMELSFQQVQKYEKGKNRIGAGALYIIAAYLEVPVGYFYEGIESTETKRTDTMADFLASPRGPDVARNFPKLPNAAAQRGFADLLAAVTGARQ